jgi:hypothetical protein
VKATPAKAGAHATSTDVIWYVKGKYSDSNEVAGKCRNEISNVECSSDSLRRVHELVRDCEIDTDCVGAEPERDAGYFEIVSYVCAGCECSEALLKTINVHRKGGH